MTKKKPQSVEEFSDKQEELAELPPSFVHISPSLIELIAPHTEPPESRLGQRIKHARSDLVLSVEALSRLTREYDFGGGGLSPTSISRYESGEALPGLREFRLISESLEVPVEWLLYGFSEAEKPAFPPEDVKLLYALKSFVAAQREDVEISSPENTEWFRKQVRMEKLNKARKPVQKDQSN